MPNLHRGYHKTPCTADDPVYDEPQLPQKTTKFSDSALIKLNQNCAYQSNKLKKEMIVTKCPAYEHVQS